MTLQFAILMAFLPIPDPHQTTLAEWLEKGPYIVRTKTILEVEFTDVITNGNCGFEFKNSGQIGLRWRLPHCIHIKLTGYSDEYWIGYELDTWVRAYRNQDEAMAALSKAAIKWAKEQNKRG